MSVNLLMELERRLQTPLYKVFDLVLGTSTGAIQAAGLTIPSGPNGQPHAAEQLLSFYRNDGPSIFPMGRAPTSKEKLTGRRDMSFWQEMMSSAQHVGSLFGGNRRFAGGARHFDTGLMNALNATFGDLPMTTALTRLSVAAFDLNKNRPVVLTSDDQILVRDAVRGSAAAPTYLQPHTTNGWNLIDGGVWANNPILLSLPDVVRSSDELTVVSIGTGIAPAGSSGREDWLAQTARLVGYATETEMSDFVFSRAVRPQEYFRFQFELPGKVSMDDPSVGNLDGLAAIASQAIGHWSSHLNVLTERLLND